MWRAAALSAAKPPPHQQRDEIARRMPIIGFLPPAVAVPLG